MKTQLLLISLTLSCLGAPSGRELSTPGEQEQPAANSKASVESAFDHRHELWTGVLRAHVAADRFDYAALKKDRGALDRYLRSLEAVPPAEFARWTREQQYAFWINAYNAYTVSLVVEKHPVDSIKDIGSLLKEVWDREFVPLKPLFPEAKGDQLSLNDIEHRILRPKFKDARVHAAVNCASIGCPPLRAEAFVAEKLEAQLDEQVRLWLADPARNRYDRAKNGIEISKVFDWFEEDFVRDADSLQAWIAKYAPPAEAEWIRSAKKLAIEHRDYSWKLNAR
jgi:hypothetical protein